MNKIVAFTVEVSNRLNMNQQVIEIKADSLEDVFNKAKEYAAENEIEVVWEAAQVVILSRDDGKPLMSEI